MLLLYDLFALYLKMILSVRLSAINSQGCIRKSEEKKELLGTAKSRQWPSDFVVMFAFYQLNCKNKVLIHPSSPLHYDITIRINLKVTLA